MGNVVSDTIEEWKVTYHRQNKGPMHVSGVGKDMV